MPQTMRDPSSDHDAAHTIACTTACTPGSPTSSASTPSGVAVQDSGTYLGRVLVATRDYAVGDLVLQERPLLSWLARGSPMSLLKAYVAASPVRQVAVQGFFAPGDLSLVPDAQPFLLAADVAALQAAREQIRLPKHTITQLLLIEACNAHSYEVTHAALFPTAAMAQHACCPNVSYCSTRGSGLEYRATEPIAAGARILFSYLDHKHQTLQQRREALLHTKFFLCCCSRCLAPDHCRPLPCPACSGVALFTTGLTDPRQARGTSARALASRDPGGWACTTCAHRAEPAALRTTLKLESRTLRKLAEMEAAPVLALRPLAALMARARHEQARAEASFPAAHHMHARFFSLLAASASSQADLLEQADAACASSPSDALEQADAPARSPRVQEAAALRLESARLLCRTVHWHERAHALLHARTEHPVPAQQLVVDPDARRQAKVSLLKRLRKRFGREVSPRDSLSRLSAGHSNPRTSGRASKGDAASAGNVDAILEAWRRGYDGLQPCAVCIMEAFDAGMDFLSAGDRSHARLVFGRYHSLLASWLPPADEDLEIIEHLLHS